MLMAYLFTMLQGCGGGTAPIIKWIVGTNFKQRPVKCSYPPILVSLELILMLWLMNGDGWLLNGGDCAPNTPCFFFVLIQSLTTQVMLFRSASNL